MSANDAEKAATPPPILARTRTALGFDDPRLATVLALLWVTTGIYIVLHFSNWFLGTPWSPLFNLGTERGYGEIFFQMLTGWTILLLLIAAVRLRAGILVIFSGATAYLLIDDYLMIHEQAGARFAGEIWYFGSLSTHLGEFLWLALVGVIVLLALAIAYRRSRPAIRRISMLIVGIFIGLGIFGIIVDGVHNLFADHPAVDPFLIAIQDGGEIVMMCVLVVFALSLAVPASTSTMPDFRETAEALTPSS